MKNLIVKQILYQKNIPEEIEQIIIQYLPLPDQIIKKKKIQKTINNYGKMYLNSLSTNCNNTMRNVLKNKISRDKKPLPNRMIWMTPIDTIHQTNYYITGILGTHQNLTGVCRGGPPRDSLKFKIPYAYLLKLCREYGFKIPNDDKPISSYKINRFLMDIEEEYISHGN